jgi:hypothetical protein
MRSGVKWFFILGGVSLIGLQVLLFSGILDSCATGVSITPTVTSTTKVATKVPVQIRYRQAGIVEPIWATNQFASPNWNTVVETIHADTQARWIEIPVLFAQTTATANTVLPIDPQIAIQLAQGIRIVEQAHLSVFLVPLITIKASEAWAGAIQPTNVDLWFTNWIKAWLPFATLAQQLHVSQLAVGTEMQWLQDNAPSTDWDRLITTVQQVYKGTVTYDLNHWTGLLPKIQPWMLNSNLTIGVSAYFALESTPAALTPAQTDTLLIQDVIQPLDRLSAALHRPVLISEVGYRNDAAPGYFPWHQNDPAPAASPNNQSVFITSAVRHVITDPNILGIFLWGWQGVGGMALNTNLTSQDVLTTLYPKLGTTPK